MKVISDTAHGILDYLTVAIFALAPSILGLTGFAALVSYALAAIHLVMTLFTNMPLGVFKIIPMRLHALGGNACRTCSFGSRAGVADHSRR
jgi:hypothetical protein